MERERAIANNGVMNFLKFKIISSSIRSVYCAPDLQKAPEPRAAAALHFADLVVGEAGQEARQRDLPLQAREARTGADVDAAREGEVAIGRARDVEAVGVGKLRRVAVGRADADGDQRLRGQVD